MKVYEGVIFFQVLDLVSLILAWWECCDGFDLFFMENETDASQQKMNSANKTVSLHVYLACVNKSERENVWREKNEKSCETVEFASLSAESGHKCTAVPY